MLVECHSCTFCTGQFHQGHSFIPSLQLNVFELVDSNNGIDNNLKKHYHFRSCHLSRHKFTKLLPSLLPLTLRPKRVIIVFKYWHVLHAAKFRSNLSRNDSVVTGQRLFESYFDVTPVLPRKDLFYSLLSLVLTVWIPNEHSEYPQTVIKSVTIRAKFKG